MTFLTLYDFLLFPVYLIILVALLNSYFRKRHGHSPALKKHFNRGLALKLFGCIAIALIYDFYYKGAYDGRFYFEGAKMLKEYLSNYPTEILSVLKNDMYTFNLTNKLGLKTYDSNIWANQSFFVSKVAFVFNLVSFNSFIPCSLFFCAFAFIALWNLFIFFKDEYKLPVQLAALATLYIPSVLIWSSSIFKDTISFTALIWLFICGYYSFIKPRKTLVNIIGFLIAAFFIIQVKVYILAAFIPFFILYIFNTYKKRIKNAGLRIIATPIVIGIALVIIGMFFQNAEELLGRYSAEEVLETATKTSEGIASAGQAGSAYTINVDFNSTTGLLKAIPAGINITLFRPYPWEYLKPFTLLASAESMIMLYFTLFVFFKVGIGRSFREIWKSPVLQFSLLFSLLFAFMVGISSSNFGSLVRYKIPLLPFYILFLCVLYNSKFKSNKAVPSKSSVLQNKYQHLDLS